MLSLTRSAATAAAATASCPLSTLHCVSREELAIGEPCEARYCALSTSTSLSPCTPLFTQAEFSNKYEKCTLQIYLHVATVHRAFSKDVSGYSHTGMYVLGPQKVCARINLDPDVHSYIYIHIYFWIQVWPYALKQAALRTSGLLWLYQGCPKSIASLACICTIRSCNKCNGAQHWEKKEELAYRLCYCGDIPM